MIVTTVPITLLILRLHIMSVCVTGHSVFFSRWQDLHLLDREERSLAGGPGNRIHPNEITLRVPGACRRDLLCPGAAKNLGERD